MYIVLFDKKGVQLRFFNALTNEEMGDTIIVPKFKVVKENEIGMGQLRGMELVSNGLVPLKFDPLE